MFTKPMRWQNNSKSLIGNGALSGYALIRENPVDPTGNTTKQQYERQI